ncbi:hypothetical protein N3K66_006702 [Trichothecium roseum]|uniref:Uncharacterized protein n=1 Tax=Trichothecium roseum TaxID=47278 RepID=A0ACC0UW33_9HYPO|nr:hypothetical protein N3K66_006702 [Trichothecium roseum]
MVHTAGRVLLLAFFLFYTAVAAAPALGASPNSPCYSVCIAPHKQPPLAASSTNIVCGDSDVRDTKEGKRFEECLSCLEESRHEEEDSVENDQAWFLYGLRSSLQQCLFKATHAESNCLGPQACGPLKKAVEQDLDDDHPELGAGRYDYCDIDGGSILGEQVDSCFTCVRAGGDHSYLSNYLTALKTGCEQKPSANETLGLNDTVFAVTRTESLSERRSSSSSSSSSANLDTASIVGIVVGVIVALAIITAGAIFLHRHRLRNKRGGSSADSLHSESQSPPFSSKEKKAAVRPTSPLSFRCQTHLTPLTPDFPAGLMPEFPSAPSSPDEDGYVDPSAALRSNPIVVVPPSTPRKNKEKKWSAAKRFSAKVASRKSSSAVSEKKNQKRSVLETVRSVEPTPPLPPYVPATAPRTRTFAGGGQNHHEVYGGTVQAQPSSTVSVWSNGAMATPPRPRRPDSIQVTTVSSVSSIAGLAIASPSLIDNRSRSVTPSFTFPGMAVSTPGASSSSRIATPQSAYSSEKEVCWRGRPSMDGPVSPISPVKRKGTLPMVGSPVEIINMRTEFPPPPPPKY